MAIYNLTLYFETESDKTDFMRTVDYGLKNTTHLYQLFDILGVEINENEAYIGDTMITDISLISLAAAEEPYIDYDYLNCARIIDVIDNTDSVIFNLTSLYDLTRFITKLMSCSNIVDYYITEGEACDT